MKKILIIQKRIGLGDFCVFLPAINEISKFFSEYQVDVMTKERTQAKEFIFDHNYINDIFYAPERSLENFNFIEKDILDRKNLSKPPTLFKYF